MKSTRFQVLYWNQGSGMLSTLLSFIKNISQHTRSFEHVLHLKVQTPINLISSCTLRQTTLQALPVFVSQYWLDGWWLSSWDILHWLWSSHHTTTKVSHDVVVVVAAAGWVGWAVIEQRLSCRKGGSAQHSFLRPRDVSWTQNKKNSVTDD